MLLRPHHDAGRWLILITMVSAIFAAPLRGAVQANEPLEGAAANVQGVATIDDDPASEAANDDAAPPPGDDEPLPTPETAELPPVPDREREALPGLPGGGGGASDSDSSLSGPWVLQTLAALAFVIALIYALRAVIMRLSGTRPGGFGVNQLVEVVARTSIGPKTQVLFLKIHQRVVVVAQTPNGLDTLTTLEAPEDVAWLLGEVEAARPMSITRSFRDAVHRFDKEYAAGETPAVDRSEQYVDRTRDQVSGLLSRIRHFKHRSEG